MKLILTFLFFILISQTVSAQTKVDEFGKLMIDDVSSRLDSFTYQMSLSPKSKGLIVINKEKSAPLGKFLRRFYGIQRYVSVVTNNLIRLEFKAGEEIAENTQCWLIDEHEKFPELKLISIEDRLKEKIAGKTLFDRECIECSPPVNIDLFIFNEGLDYFAEALKANPASTALIEIDSVGFISKSRKEKSDLTSKITNNLSGKHKISRDRLKVRFMRSSSEAKFYIIPSKR